MTNFDRALAITLKFEGGWSNDPIDPGGATMKGCTQRVYDEFRDDAKPPLPRRSVREIADDELSAIYRKGYWREAGCDDFAWPLCAAVFDFAVNSGVPRATRELQRIVGVPVDGVMGVNTRGAIAGRPPVQLAGQLTVARRAFFRGLATSKPPLQKFLAGWLKRCDQLDRALGTGIA